MLVSAIIFAILVIVELKVRSLRALQNLIEPGNVQSGDIDDIFSSMLSLASRDSPHGAYV